MTTVKTQLTSAQTELTTLRQQEADLRMQLSKAQSDCEKYKYELAHAKDSHTGIIVLNSKPLFKHFTMKINDEIWRFNVSLDVIFKMNFLTKLRVYIQKCHGGILA